MATIVTITKVKEHNTITKSKVNSCTELIYSQRRQFGKATKTALSDVYDPVVVNISVVARKKNQMTQILVI